MDWRRLLILVVTVGLLVGAFTLYRYFLVDEIALVENPDLNIEETGPRSKGGKLGGIDITVMYNPTFQNRKDGKITQEFGWLGKLNYSRANYWEMEEPFIRIFQSNMTIEVTARYGKMQTDTVAGEMQLEDASFSGEVCIHVSPTEESKVEECWIHMEEMVFISDRSEFSSEGEISFRSLSLDMEGHDLHFVYNNFERKVQFFRLDDLDHMVVRVPDSGLFFRDQVPVPTPGSSAVVIRDPNEKEDLPQALAAALAGQLYHCRLHRNVMLQTPKQAIYSGEGVVLTHILWPKGALEKWQGGGSEEIEDPNGAEAVATETQEDSTQDANASSTITELTMTCDGGVTIIPEGMDWPDEEVLTEVFDEQEARARALAQLSEDQSWFAARKITHHVLQQHAVAEGPVELTFYSPDLMDPNNDTVLVPVKVTAKDRAEYDPNSNDIVFTGDCQCTLIRRDPNQVEQYSLTAQRLTACLADDKDEEVIAASRNVESLLADGNDVVLRIITADPNQLACDQGVTPEAIRVGAQMECQRCSYHPKLGYEIFTAMGPGNIQLNNARGQGEPDPNEDQESFYAFVRNYEVLQFFFLQDDPNLTDEPFQALNRDLTEVLQSSQAEHIIVADAQERTMEMIYIPTVEGELLPEITAQADHVGMILTRIAQGALELKYLTATGDVFYRDAKNELTAYGLSYDYETGKVLMWSDLKQVCYANGVPVPGIEMNIKTGELKLDIVGPSALPIGQQSSDQ